MVQRKIVAKQCVAAEAIDPTRIRLSKHFLLSDLIGCHTVYSTGLRNVFDDPDGEKLVEGRYLAEQILEPIVEESPVSISYGYISRELAATVVRYQSPNKPSYHQWNDGAACDLVVHRFDEQDVPAIQVARAIDEQFPVSRLITYSESPFLCVATRAREGNQPRKAFYENRYCGRLGQKPVFITVPENREEFFKNHSLRHPWRGAGYPTYHGGGRKQLHHYRVGAYSMLSDFLYSTEAVTTGRKNCPTLTGEWLAKFQHAGSVYAWILENAGVNRLSVTRAYESPLWSKDARYFWREQFAIDFIPPEGVALRHMQDVASQAPGVYACGVMPGERRFTIMGHFS